MPEHVLISIPYHALSVSIVMSSSRKKQYLHCCELNITAVLLTVKRNISLLPEIEAFLPAEKEIHAKILELNEKSFLFILFF